jgi:hypothetical protein
MLYEVADEAIVQIRTHISAGWTYVLVWRRREERRERHRPTTDRSDEELCISDDVQ